MGIITTESGNKKPANHWVTVVIGSSDHPENLTRSELKNVISVASEFNLSLNPTVSWAFDSAGNKTGYYVSIFIEDTHGESELTLATDRNRFASRVFKSFDAAESLLIDCGFDSVRVDFG